MIGSSKRVTGFRNFNAQVIPQLELLAAKPFSWGPKKLPTDLIDIKLLGDDKGSSSLLGERKEEKAPEKLSVIIHRRNT